MILITSAAYITPALASEFGKLPPCMLPVQNRRLYEHQIALIPEDETVVLSLPKSYTVSTYDEKRLNALGVTIIKAPDELSLGQSIVYVLNVFGRYTESVGILHGDTLFSSLPSDKDVCAIALAEDNYDWASVSRNDKMVFAGYFAFSDQSLLIQKITENGYKFIVGVKEYANVKKLRNIVLENWMDFGLSNSYYRSISKMTTQRVFNTMKVTRYGVIKSSRDKRKMAAEANWMSSLPASMKHYAPAVWNSGENDECGFYEIEYYYLSSLANLFVFGKIQPNVWEEVIDSCVAYINDEARYKPQNAVAISKQNDQLYARKTIKRLEDYANQTGISLDIPFLFNYCEIPSLRQIVEQIEPLLSKRDTRFATLMHGDFCFSNILFCFKSKSIKIIDPRGLDIEGNLSVYGDLRYDVGKLAHSILGLYDFIIGGMFEYSERSPYDVELHFEESDELLHIQDYFEKQTFGGYSITELSTYPILIHLFLSMLPLHSDFPLRQKAMLANALRLYVKLINTTKL